MYDRIIVSNRYKDLCRNVVKIASKAAKTKESSVFFAKKMVELDLDAERILKKRSHLPSNNIVTDPSHNEHVDVASGINAYKAMGIKEKMGTSSVKGRPKIFIEKGSRKKRRPNAQPLVTNVTINISTSLPVDYVQEAHVIYLQKIIYWINLF